MLSSRKVLPLDETKQNNDNVDVKVEFELKKKQASPLSKMPTLTTEEEKLFNKFKQLLAATSVDTDAANYLNLAYAENDEDLEDLDNMAKEIVDNLAIDSAYAQFEDIKLGAIDIVLCPDKSLISRQFMMRCIIIKTFETILLLYAFASVPVYNNPFFNQFINTSNTETTTTTYVPLSFIIICTFAYYVQLNLMTSIRNSLLLVTTKDFKPIKNWKYHVKFLSEIIEILLLITLCFFALSTYIYEYNLELIFNGMAVIFIAEFDELTIDLYLHGNSKRAIYYHKLICLSYVNDNYLCKNEHMKIGIKNIDKVLQSIKKEKDECDRYMNKKKMKKQQRKSKKRKSIV